MPVSDATRSFDVLIVGAGSAGCVLAARLSEDPGLRIALVEAGGPATDPDILIPQKWPFLAGRSYDWCYRTTPQHGTADRVHEWPRGRLIGGSSCLHAMAHVRGSIEDFEPWGALTGSARWRYAGLLPAFRRLEHFSGGESEQHGVSGPLDVLLPEAEISPLVRSYWAAARQIGIPWLGDHNGGRLCGLAPNSLTLRAGRRLSAAAAYLDPVRARPQLTVLTQTLAHRLALSRERVCGIEAEVDGEPCLISARMTILCGRAGHAAPAHAIGHRARRAARAGARHLSRGPSRGGRESARSPAHRRKCLSCPPARAGLATAALGIADVP